MVRFLQIFLVLFFFFSSSQVFSQNLSYTDFHPECFKNYGKIDKDFLDSGVTYKLDINAESIIVFQSGTLLPLKQYQGEGMNLEYAESFDVLNDGNKNTYLDIDTQEKKIFEVELIKKTQAGRFYFMYDIPLRYHSMKLLISTDGVTYNQVTPENIGDFSFQYFKIEFLPLDSNNPVRESVRVSELGFRSKNKTFLLESLYKNSLEIYSGYSCNEKLGFQNPVLTKPDLDALTPVLYMELFSNPKYNTTFQVDTDNDWIGDNLDNCVSFYNPLQEDENGDGQGNACSDQDRDGTLGYFDNCPSSYNPKQLDINRNAVGDACEFDKDKDGIYDSIDNAISKSNPNQEDSDRDGIGDIIDNCSLYNPTQSDRNQNQKGDVCDDQDLKLATQDQDNDEMLDSQDNCKEISNAKQEDGDEDGVGDSCDICRDLQNPLQEDVNQNKIGDLCEDSDQDSFLGYLDNCMYYPNPDQKDTNNDTIGDVCQDDDSDGKVFHEDNCPFNSNSLQEDVDKDEIGDVCDVEDNRFLESNKYVFLGIMFVLLGIFIGALFFMYKKIQK